MTLLPGYEPIIDALIARFQANLPAAIAQANAEDTKGVTLADFDQTRGILDYIPAPSELTVFPTLGVQDGPSILSDDVGWSATGNHRLVVVVFMQEPDQRTMAIKLRRYTRCIRSVALAGRSLPPAWGVVDAGTKPGPTIGSDEGPRQWLSFTATALDFRSEQDAQ